jgi:hypothetical protein
VDGRLRGHNEKEGVDPTSFGQFPIAGHMIASPVAGPVATPKPPTRRAQKPPCALRRDWAGTRRIHSRSPNALGFSRACSVNAFSKSPGIGGSR